MRSVQQAWGYSDEFMAWEPDALVVTPEQIESAVTNVLEREGNVVGYYVLRGEPPEIEMSRLMVDPRAFGTGCARLLWEDAVAVARVMGALCLTLDADPNAEPFYLHMGAETVGEHDWEPPMVPGWRLKKMRFAVPDAIKVL